jgi:hypothetical protein
MNASGRRAYLGYPATALVAVRCSHDWAFWSRTGETCGVGYLLKCGWTKGAGHAEAEAGADLRAVRRTPEPRVYSLGSITLFDLSPKPETFSFGANPA